MEYTNEIERQEVIAEWEDIEQVSLTAEEKERMFPPAPFDNNSKEFKMLSSLKKDLEKLVSSAKWELVKSPGTIQASIEAKALLLNAIKKLNKCTK